jgi:hypothetical protein
MLSWSSKVNAIDNLLCGDTENILGESFIIPRSQKTLILRNMDLLLPSDITHSSLRVVYLMTDLEYFLKEHGVLSEKGMRILLFHSISVLNDPLISST